MSTSEDRTTDARDPIVGARQAAELGPAEVAPIVMWAYLGGVVKEYDALASRLAAVERERDKARAESDARATFVNGAINAQLRLTSQLDDLTRERDALSDEDGRLRKLIDRLQHLYAKRTDTLSAERNLERHRADAAEARLEAVKAERDALSELVSNEVETLRSHHCGPLAAENPVDAAHLADVLEDGLSAALSVSRGPQDGDVKP